MPFILYLPAWYPYPGDSMLGLFIKRHIEAILPKIKLAVVLFVFPNPSKSQQNYDICKNTEDGIITYRVFYKKNQKPIIKLFINGYRYFKACFKGYRTIYKNYGRPNISHVNVLTRAGIFALFLKIKYNIPYLVTEHWSRYLKNTGRYRGLARKFLTKIVVKNAECVTTVTSNLKNAMLSHGLKNQYFITPNVVDVNKFNLQEKKPIPGKKQIIHISCFEDRSKNISGLLRIVKKLSRLRQDFEFVFVGEGIDFDNLVDYAKILGIYNTFTFFTGLLENEKLIKALQQSQLMVMFSNYENLPVVILESFSCGVPVLSTDVGGISEFFNKNLGLLSEVKDEERFIEKLTFMLDNIESYAPSTIRDYAIKHFSNEVIADKFNTLYLKVLNNQSICLDNEEETNTLPV